VKIISRRADPELASTANPQGARKVTPQHTIDSGSRPLRVCQGFESMKPSDSLRNSGANEAGHNAHLSGQAAAALMSLASPPAIARIDVLLPSFRKPAHDAY
jgi:hypothetical protein